MNEGKVKEQTTGKGVTVDCGDGSWERRNTGPSDAMLEMARPSGS